MSNFKMKFIVSTNVKMAETAYTKTATYTTGFASGIKRTVIIQRWKIGMKHIEVFVGDTQTDSITESIVSDYREFKSNEMKEAKAFARQWRFKHEKHFKEALLH